MNTSNLTNYSNMHMNPSKVKHVIKKYWLPI